MSNPNPTRKLTAKTAPVLADLSNEDLLAAIAEAGSIRALARKAGVPRSTIQDEMYRRGIKSESAQKAKTASPAATAPPVFADASIVRGAGLDPDLFEVSGASTTETEGDDFSASSVKYSFRRRRPTVGQAHGAARDVPPPVSVDGERSTWLILSDQHAPHTDMTLHEIILGVIADVKPDGLLLLGDLLDLPTLSRHQAAPGEASVQECIDMGNQILTDYRCALGDTGRMVALLGNHDVRVARWTAQNASPIAMVRQAGGREVLSIEHLLNTDSLGIEVVHGPGAPSGAYQMASWVVVPDRLVAIHGNRARKNATMSALSTARDRGHGVVHGHTHRMGVACFSLWNTDGTPRPYHAAEAGTLARINEGMGYAPAESRDWQQGALMLTVWADGAHSFDPMLYCRGSLTLRDKRYRWDPDTECVTVS